MNGLATTWSKPRIKKQQVKRGGGPTLWIRFGIDQPRLEPTTVVVSSQQRRQLPAISSRHTSVAPQVGAGLVTGDEAARRVFLLYDVESKPHRLHWLFVCGQTVVPYEPLRPSVGHTRRYRWETFLVPCSVDLQQHFVSMWKRYPEKRTESWIQSLILEAQQERYPGWKRYGRPIDFLVFTPKPPSLPRPSARHGGHFSSLLPSERLFQRPPPPMWLM